MQGMIKAVESVLSIIVIIGIGYYLSYKNWFNEEISNAFVKLVTRVTLPMMMFSTMINKFTREDLLGYPIGVLVPMLSIGICYGIGIFSCKLLKVSEGKKGLFTSMFFNSNTIFMGLPINVALFGEESIPFVLLYYIGNTTFFWTFGIYEISRDNKENTSKIFSKNNLKNIFSPPLLGYIGGLAFILLNIKVPGFLNDTLSKMGNVTTPISMIFIGITIYSIKFKEIKVNKEILGVLMGRFIVCPIVTLMLCNIFAIPELMRGVFVIQAAMPVMTNTAIVAKSYNVDTEYAAVLIGLSTLLSLIVIPIYMGII